MPSGRSGRCRRSSTATSAGTVIVRTFSPSGWSARTRSRSAEAADRPSPPGGRSRSGQRSCQGPHRSAGRPARARPPHQSSDGSIGAETHAPRTTHRGCCRGSPESWLWDGRRTARSPVRRARRRSSRRP
jgi:hypothetical protein